VHYKDFEPLQKEKYCALIEHHVLGTITSLLDTSAGSKTSDSSDTTDSTITSTTNPAKQHNILLCISGGCDSMAMFHLLTKAYRALRGTPHEFRLEVINFNHKQRVESYEEALFVAEWASRYSIPTHIREWPIPADPKSTETGFQAAARNWRKGECDTWVRTSNTNSNEDNTINNIVATAHNLDDQIETLCLKFLRGVHLSNFQPMKMSEGHYIKPVLGLSKDQLRDYLLAR
jgi:tRNA(Ile)-lysidine synthase